MYFYDAQGFYNKPKCIEGFFNNFNFANSSPPSSQPPAQQPAQTNKSGFFGQPAQPPAQQPAQTNKSGFFGMQAAQSPAQQPAQPQAAQQPAQPPAQLQAAQQTQPPAQLQAAQPPAQQPAQQTLLGGVNVAVKQPAQQSGSLSTNVQIPNLKDVVVLGKLGMSPWGEAPGFLDKEAQWIWFTPNANKSAPGSANASFIYTWNNTSSSNISAKINIIVDNKSSIIVNDKNIGEQKGGWGGSGGLFNVTLQPGTNDFVFNATNVGSSPNPAGLLVSVLNNNNTVLFRTGDNGWKYLSSQQSRIIPTNVSTEQPSNQNLNKSILNGYVNNLVLSKFNELNKSNETNRIINMNILTLKDPEVFIINDETKANSYDEESSKIFRVFYKPKLEKSKILIEISSYYDINGTHDDKFECEINVSEDKNHYTDSKGGKRIAIRKIRFEKNIGGGARSGSFFPSGVFHNNNNKPKYFHFNVKREGSDDRFKLARGKNSKFLDVEGLIKITEIKTSK